MIEPVVSVRFLEHHNYEAHSLLHICQSAYRAYHSTETGVAIVHNNIVRNIEQKNHVSVLVLLDLSAVFDTVDHKLLLDILEWRLGKWDLALK